MSTEFEPFDNDTQSTTVGPDGGITFENDPDHIIMYGDINISSKTRASDIDDIIEVLTKIKAKLK